MIVGLFLQFEFTPLLEGRLYYFFAEKLFLGAGIGFIKVFG
jgi:hypothetical protein